MKSCTENTESTVASSNPQTIGGVDRAVGRGPTEHLRDELDLTYGAIKSGHKFTPSLELIEHICTLAKASASTIEHQLSVIGEYETALKPLAEIYKNWKNFNCESVGVSINMKDAKRAYYLLNMDRNAGWWCVQCQKEVAPEAVTYEETHDIRAGGCGEPVGIKALSHSIIDRVGSSK